MSKFLKSDFGYISILIILFLCFLPAFFMHQGLLLIDTGREFYIPSRILAGEALFKDIFIIYGPFSYLFNAFIMKIFGQSLYSIYIAGLFNSLLIILFIYLISAQFIKKNLSFLIAWFPYSRLFITPSYITQICLIHTQFLMHWAFSLFPFFV